MKTSAHLVVASALLAALVHSSACVTSDAHRCNENLVCPTGMSCSPSGQSCIDSDLLDSCRGRKDGESCAVAGFPPATCLGGMCQAARCGDGKITGAEECDGDLLNGRDCQTFGYYESAGLRCSASCRYDASQCTGRCGDGVKNGREECDGKDLGGATCFTAGFYKAAGLACGADCKLDIKGCSGGRCGDGVINGLEQCDGAQFTKTCDTLGFAGAMSGMSCTRNCTYAAQSCLCAPGQRCKAKNQRCDCSKLGGCGCVATQ